MVHADGVEGPRRAASQGGGHRAVVGVTRGERVFGTRGERGVEGGGQAGRRRG